MELPMITEDGIVEGVVTGRYSSGRRQHLQHESPVLEHRRQEPGNIVAPLGIKPVVGIHQVLYYVLQCSHVCIHGFVGSLEEMEESSALVIVHPRQMMFSVVIRAQVNYLRIVGLPVELQT
ncbi:hypothetical protein Sjap_016722 [Stephania japonica]|uniref:Uncharacterized protein n=1 Tax=Stephania japonica TaxID=461633 RepID=A0AAP0NU38_9MAGN